MSLAEVGTTRFSSEGENTRHLSELRAVDEREALELTPERANGEYEMVRFFPEEFIKMAQVRGTRNPVSEALKESIVRREPNKRLINAIDVVRLDDVKLAEYIEFVNHVWNKDTTLDSFAGSRHQDGFYYLVIAGHSRHEAMTVLMQDELIPRERIAAKVHEVNGPEDIISIQLDENIHSQPPRERVATVIVEMYNWGIKKGEWANQKEFRARHPDISKSQLSEALHFAELDEKIRDFVTFTSLPLATAIEIGKTQTKLKDMILNYIGFESMDDLQPEDRDILEVTVDKHLMHYATHISESKLSIARATRYIELQLAELQVTYARTRRQREEAAEQALTGIDFITEKEMLKDLHDGIDKDRRALLRAVTRKPGTHAREIVKLNLRGAEFDSEFTEALVKDLQSTSEQAARMIGGTATKSTQGLF